MSSRDDYGIQYLSNAPERVLGWSDEVMAVTQLAALVIKVIEQVKRGASGPDKLAGAVQLLKAQEPIADETPELTAAREAMISAQVQYANALAAASQ